ncbi:DUF6445 family protein [Kitasatospora sp. NPDC056731]|uniref:DUF6445 family protein n=1 Tax=Kitasatospora sp. NPDC056731 TaxID=3155422 RepID=UPI0034415956
MLRKLIIVDDFYADPDKVRTRALSTDYADITPTDYPGLQSRYSLRTDALARAFNELVQARICSDPARFTWGGFRCVTEASGRGTKVHADIAIDWAAMVYLTPDAPMEAGTGFFRHRETGVEAPPTDRQARALGFRDASDFDDKVVRRDMADLSKWEQTGWVGPVYNRLVLFRGSEVYHAPLAGCGSDAATGRLTHNFFFNVVTDPVDAVHRVEV